MTGAIKNEWVNILQQAVQSRESGKEHQYVVSDGKSYTLLSKSQLDAQHQKVPLQSIVEKTQEQFQQLNQLASEGEIDQKQLGELSARLTDYTDTLIEGQVTKREQSVGRKLAYAIAIVGILFFGLGIPLYRKLKRQDADFSREMAVFREAIGVGIRDNIKREVDAIPGIISSLYDQVPDSDREQMLQKRMKEDYPKDPAAPFVEQFAKDMKRDVTFLRHDPELKIKDETIKTFDDLYGKLEERFKLGKTLLNDILVNETDNNWKFALQLNLSQTPFNIIFDGFIFVFVMDAVGKQLLWNDPINGAEYSLKADLGKKEPIILDVIRDPETKKIKQVNIEVSGYANIVSDRKSGTGPNKVVAPQAVYGKLTYTVTLDDQTGRAKISNLKSEMGVPTPESKPIASEQAP